MRESLEELAELAATAGGSVIGTATQKVDAPVAGTFIGSGKAEELALFCKKNDVDTVIFDDELSAAQSRNLERIFGCKILDRTIRSRIRVWTQGARASACRGIDSNAHPSNQGEME